jgi:hypothetical protein
MKRSLPLVALAVSLIAPGWSLHAAPEADAAAGREIVKRYADAIVGVELVVTIKRKAGDREMPPQEARVEVNGTVISSSGLTVTTLAAVDPQATQEAMRAGGGGGRGAEIVSSEFKEVKLRTADGKEIPARFVLKDADLDLAFMAPEPGTEGAARTFPYLKLDDAVEGTQLSTFFSLSRAPKALQRIPLVRSTEITGIIEKPRRFYLLSDQNVAAPIFNAQGKLLGITLVNSANGLQALVVRPAADIADMAKQAAEAQNKPVEPPKIPNL